jgi:hypothetical protein
VPGRTWDDGSIDLAETILPEWAGLGGEGPVRLGNAAARHRQNYDPFGKRLWGNFPQAYSHAGLFNAAFAASSSWSEVL